MPQKSVYPQSTLEQTSNEQLAQESMSDIVERFETVAGEVSEDHEAIISAFDGTSGFGECPIAPDVLAKLLPDDKVVELPRLTRVSGGSLYRFAKRMFDVVACSVALAVLAVPMVVIAIMVKRQSPGPVVYAQMRVGKDGRPFKIYKFRSMYSDAEARGAQWAFGGDPRVTPIGHTLRKTRLDEIPQFWNVVKGDIPSRILKTRQGFSLKKPGAFALPAKLARTRIAASLQVRAVICAVAGVPQNLFEYFIAGYGEMREVFCKTRFSHRFSPSWPL